MKKPRMTEEFESTLSNALRQLDIHAYVYKLKVADVRALLADDMDIKASHNQVTWVASEVCRYWRKRRRERKSPSNCLTSSRWDQVIGCVERCLPDLEGLSKLEAMEVVRAYTSVNMSIMNGLPRRLRVWEQRRAA